MTTKETTPMLPSVSPEPGPAREPMPDPPEPEPTDTALLHGARVLAYVLSHGRPAVWRASETALERALSFSLIAMSAPDMIDRARDRIVDARRLMSAELHARQQNAERAARDAARLAAQPGPRSPFPAPPSAPDGDSGDNGGPGHGARLLPRPKINPPAGTHANFDF